MRKYSVACDIVHAKCRVLAQDKLDYTPKVSVIIPVYNGAQFLRECLDSVTGQSLRELEIICVDDGSVDDSVDILHEYASRDNRITILAQQNSGSGPARNNGISAARGQFIAFMDCDDLYPAENTLESMYDAAIKNNVKICGGSVYQLRGDTLCTDPTQFEDCYTFTKDGLTKYADYQADYGYWRFIYNREFLLSNNLYFPDYLRQQDPIFFVRAMYAAGVFYAMRAPTYVYRVMHKQVHWTERKATDMFRGLRDVLMFSRENNLIHLHKTASARVNTWTARTAFGECITSVALRTVIYDVLDLVDADVVLDDLWRAVKKSAQTGAVASVIIPVYNVEKYLARCLDSVVGQTLRDIEIICVDDGSTDASAKILSRYAARDPRIKIVRQKNAGLSAARNRGIDMASADYITFVDSDDWIEPQTLAMAVAKMTGMVDIVAWGANIVNEGLPENDYGILVGNDYHCVRLSGERTIDENIIANSTYTVWNKLFKRRILDDFNIRFAEGRLFEDNDFTIMYMMHCRRGYFYDAYLYNYSQRPGSIMEKLRSGKCDRTVDNMYIFDNIYRHCVRYGLARKYGTTLTRRLGNHWHAAYKFAPADKKNFIRDTARQMAMGYDASLFRDDTVRLAAAGQFDKIPALNEIIVSLTSWPGRINTVHKTIESLLNQKWRPDKIILWLAPEQFPNKEADLPSELMALCARGLVIDWYHDIRSYKKLIPTLRKYPDAIIVTADDDNIYSPTWLGKLVDSYIRHPHDIQCHRVTKIWYDRAGFHTIAGGRDYYRGTSFLNKLVGLGGVLYPPHCFHEDILNEDLILRLAPTNDDQWFWLMAALNGVGVRVVPSPEIDAHYVPGTQEVGLTRINDGGAKLFWRDFRAIMSHYPQLNNILKAEWRRNRFDTSNLKHAYRDELEKWYRRVTGGKDIHLDNPKTFNQKIQWLKLYHSTPEKTRLADKYLVRDWVAETIGAEYLIPLLGVYDRFDDIDFDALPSRFVIKCNHGCGYNIVVKDKSKLDLIDARKKVEKWMQENFAYHSGLELHYRDIVPKIIIEEFIENEGTGDLYDYKFWCFNGRVHYIQFLSERNLDGLKMAFYDRTWKKQDFVYNYPMDEKDNARPDNLDAMIKLAETMARGFPHVRVDFYRMNDGRIYFGEMTFTSATGTCGWSTPEINRHLGRLIKLPPMAYDVDSGVFYKFSHSSWLGRTVGLRISRFVRHLRRISTDRHHRMLGLIKVRKKHNRQTVEFMGIRIWKALYSGTQRPKTKYYLCGIPVGSSEARLTRDMYRILFIRVSVRNRHRELIMAIRDLHSQIEDLKHTRK